MCVERQCDRPAARMLANMTSTNVGPAAAQQASARGRTRAPARVERDLDQFDASDHLAERDFDASRRRQRGRRDDRGGAGLAAKLGRPAHADGRRGNPGCRGELVAGVEAGVEGVLGVDLTSSPSWLTACELGARLRPALARARCGRARRRARADAQAQPPRPRLDSSRSVACSAAKLAVRSHVAVYPVIGWWRERLSLGKSESRARYALVLSIRTPPSSMIDIYQPVAARVGVAIPIVT